jgi:Fe-S-cluster containining protein
MANKKRDKQVNKAFAQLEQLYRSIPDTKGCMENINKPAAEGGCGGWCCQIQNPHVLYVEFLNSWRYVLKHWEWQKIANLVEAALRNYLSKRPTKGCVFFDMEKKLCSQHTTRPLACRVYGIEPEDEFKPKYERLKVLYQNSPEADIRDQCGLVSTVNGTKVTKKMTQDWWNQAVEVEKTLGVKKAQINDKTGGTYHTYHDHILLHVVPDVVMKQVQILRLHGTTEEKETAIQGIMSGFRRKIKLALGKSEPSDVEVDGPTPSAKPPEPLVKQAPKASIAKALDAMKPFIPGLSDEKTQEIEDRIKWGTTVQSEDSDSDEESSEGD